MVSVRDPYRVRSENDDHHKEHRKIIDIADAISLRNAIKVYKRTNPESSYVKALDDHLLEVTGSDEPKEPTVKLNWFGRIIQWLTVK